MPLQDAVMPTPIGFFSTTVRGAELCFQRHCLPYLPSIFCLHDSTASCLRAWENTARLHRPYRRFIDSPVVVRLCDILQSTGNRARCVDASATLTVVVTEDGSAYCWGMADYIHGADKVSDTATPEEFGNAQQPPSRGPRMRRRSVSPCQHEFSRLNTR